MPKISDDEFGAIRDGLKRLPRAAHHTPGAEIDLDNIVVAQSHRAALDPDRTLVVGNRGVGKSFWTDVLADPKARGHVARSFRELAAVDVVIGFNASERVEPVAPTLHAINSALQIVDDADSLWRTVLVRAARDRGVVLPAEFPVETFADEATWVSHHPEQVDRIITELDDRFAKQNKKLIVVFDALDRLGPDWQTRRMQTAALLRRALAARSYHSIRLKLFMRRDQYEDPRLFQFADGSKIANQRVDLQWNPNELYRLLFLLLENDTESSAAFVRLVATYVSAADRTSEKSQQVLVKAIVGEFMGATAKQGRVYTWLPLHLADARGETSPRTFLTAWREAAIYQPSPARRALDYRGIHEGVRKASEDRVSELEEDYWWIKHALKWLRNQQVPMDRASLKRLWLNKKTAAEILEASSIQQLPPVRLDSAKREGNNLEDALIDDLVAIGIMERRPNDKINIPDIFRLEAGIKRKGGVPAPKRAQRE
jgi:hypothetical protein